MSAIAVGAPILGLFGIGVTSIVNAVLGALSSWVLEGARTLAGLFARALAATTTVRFSGGFSMEFSLLRHFGAELTSLFLVAAVLRAIVARDLGQLGRTVAIGLPVALCGSGVALELVVMLVRATDGLSGALLAGVGGSVGRFLAGLSAVVAGTGFAAPALGGFAALAVGLSLAVVVFCCWVELVLRAGAIMVASLFLPIALAGVVFPATRHWIRRLAETIVALVASKAVIAAVFALALSSMGTASGIAAVAEGLALFSLAALSPLAMLRLVPVAEAAVGSHLGRTGGQAVRAARSVAPLVSDQFFPPVEAHVEARDGIGFAPGESSMRLVVEPEDLSAFSFLGEYVVARASGAEGGASTVPRPPEWRHVDDLDEPE